jgi:EmrB/QacA subfamily drug resistance transporter
MDVLPSGTNRRLITLAAFASTFLVSLDTAVMATAMPTVVTQLGGIASYAWVFSAYLLASTVTVPVYGKLADLVGRKSVFLASTLLFLVGSMLCGVSQDMTQLILFRVVQGIGAGGITPSTQTILGDIYTLPERAKIAGIFSAIWGISGLMGPAIGGLLTEHFNWRAVFYVNGPICLLAMGLIWSFLHERIERRQVRIDYPGAILLSTGVTALLFGLQGDLTLQDIVLPAPALYAIAVVSLAGFIVQERRHPEPLVPLTIFANRVIVACTLAATAGGAAWYGMLAFVPPYLQSIQGATPLVAGLVLGITDVGWTIASTTMGHTVMRVGLRPPAVLGGLLAAVGFAAFRFVPVDSGLWLPSLITFEIGLGLGLFLPLTTIAAQNAVGWSLRGVVTGMSMFARTIGGSVGVAIAGTVFAAGISVAAATGVDPNLLVSNAGRAQVPADQAAALQVVLAHTLGDVFMVFVAAGLCAAAALAFLPSRVQEPAEDALPAQPVTKLSLSNAPPRRS